MGNRIWLDSRHDAEGPSLKMSNTLTAVFISTLALAGSALAATQREKELITWLADRDQSIYGIGNVGFDIAEMPWTPGDLEHERAFIQRVIAGARARIGWDRLSYTPGEDWLLPSLADFGDLIAQLALDQIDASSRETWRQELTAAGIVPHFPRCPEHGILLHPAGCVICHDA